MGLRIAWTLLVVVALSRDESQAQTLKGTIRDGPVRFSTRQLWSLWVGAATNTIGPNRLWSSRIRRAVTTSVCHQACMTCSFHVRSVLLRPRR
jgi:hypothetical protein